MLSKFPQAPKSVNPYDCFPCKMMIQGGCGIELSYKLLNTVLGWITSVCLGLLSTLSDFLVFPEVDKYESYPQVSVVSGFQVSLASRGPRQGRGGWGGGFISSPLPLWI